jgi:hypothetical protein
MDAEPKSASGFQQLIVLFLVLLIVSCTGCDDDSIRSLDELERAAQSADPAVRERAASDLYFHGRRGVPALVDLLQDQREEVRAQAAMSLNMLGPQAEEAKGALLSALKDPSRDVRLSAAITIGKMENLTAGDVMDLAKRLDDPAPAVRFEAAEALGKAGPVAEPAIPLLVEALHDRDERVRALAAEALGKLKAFDTVPVLAERLDDHWPWVRKKAAEAIGRIGVDDDTVAARLRQAMKDDDSCVRVHSARALWLTTGNLTDTVPVLVNGLVRLVEIEQEWGPEILVIPAARHVASVTLAEIYTNSHEGRSVIEQEMKAANAELRKEIEEALRRGREASRGP